MQTDAATMANRNYWWRGVEEFSQYLMALYRRVLLRRWVCEPKGARASAVF